MKICASTYSFGSYAGTKGFEFMADKAKEYGYDGLEIVEGTFEGSQDAAAAEKFAEYAREKGLEIPSFCTGADFLYGSGGELDAEIKRVCRSVDLAAAFGCKTMRHDAAYGYRGTKHSRGYDDALPRMIEGCRAVSEYAASKGVMTCTENHGYFSQDAARVEKLINGVAADNFGALCDIGNFMCADEEPTESVGIIAPYAVMVHAKDFYFKSGSEINPGEGWFTTRAGNYLKGAVVGHGSAHAAQSLGILKRAGYDGWISVEFEGAEDNLYGLRVGITNVKRFWNL